MGGQSSAEKAANQFYQQVSDINPVVQNRFNDYSNAYGFGDISKQVNDTYGQQTDLINKDTANQVATQQQGAASNLASRGVTNGSILTDTQSKIASDVNKSKTDALANLGINKSNALSSLMEYFNNLKFAQTGAAQNADQNNFQNLLSKYGIESSAIGKLDNTTWLDDLFAGLNTAGNVAKGVGSLVHGGGGN